MCKSTRQTTPRFCFLPHFYLEEKCAPGGMQTTAGVKDAAAAAAATEGVLCRLGDAVVRALTTSVISLTQDYEVWPRTVDGQFVALVKVRDPVLRAAWLSRSLPKGGYGRKLRLGLHETYLGAFTDLSCTWHDIVFRPQAHPAHRAFTVVSSFDQVPRAPVVLLDIDDTVLSMENLNSVHPRHVRPTEQGPLLSLLVGARVVAFVTARTLDFLSASVAHLAAIGVHATADHILTSNGRAEDKGRVVAQFLTDQGLRACDVVFVDDNHLALQSVAAVVSDVRCFLYAYKKSFSQRYLEDFQVNCKVVLPPLPCCTGALFSHTAPSE